jgi:transcriptional regulator with XRE-family HTH domain
VEPEGNYRCAVPLSQTTFDQWFARIRPAVGSQQSVATALGITERALRDWEKGRSSPEPYRAERIAEVTGQPLADVEDLVMRAYRARAEGRAEKISRRSEERKAAAADAARAWAEEMESGS